MKIELIIPLYDIRAETVIKNKIHSIARDKPCNRKYLAEWNKYRNFLTKLRHLRIKNINTAFDDVL